MKSLFANAFQIHAPPTTNMQVLYSAAFDIALDTADVHSNLYNFSFNDFIP